MEEGERRRGGTEELRWSEGREGRESETNFALQSGYVRLNTCIKIRLQFSRLGCGTFSLHANTCGSKEFLS